jgi:uncharacterized protein YcfL
MKKFLPLSLLIGTLLQSCSTPPPPALDDPRIRVTAPYKWDVSVIAIGERKEENGILEMQVELFNKDDDMQKVEYKVWWFDESGFKMDSIMTQWRGASISGNGHGLIKAIAPNPKAKDFLLHVIDSFEGKIVVAVDSRLK